MAGGMSVFTFKILATLAAVVSGALAHVIPVLAGTDCSVYPGYDSSTGIAGPWILQTDSSSNSSIEGFGDSVDMFYQEGVEGIYEGYVSLVSC
jgi:hypothetical protein